MTRLKAAGLRQLLVLPVSIFCMNIGVAETSPAQRYFEAGNAEFRRGNFEAALGNYGDALAHGKVAPRVYYNMGLAHARLDQRDQARSSFHESAKSEKLAALSYYQLGALAYEAGNHDKAVEWLTRARDSASSRKLRRQATRALGRLGVRHATFESEFVMGYGYDSNAFMSPDQPYVDLSSGAPIPVVPVPKSGQYIPVRIKGDYWRPLSAKSALTASYGFRGEYYTDPALQNADYYDHRLRIGGEFKLGNSGSWSRRAGANAYFRVHGETNFDRDDGLDRFDDGQSISDRYDYQAIGAEGYLRHRIDSNRLRLKGGWEQRDYDETPTASSYDLTNLWIGGDIKFDVSEDSRLKLGYEFHVRSFDQRRSRDITGDASLSNPPIDYRYNHVEAGFRHGFSPQFVAELEYKYTIRTDEFVGYNDYRRHKIKLTSTVMMSDRLHTRVALRFRQQDYANAFAFDEPGQPAKEYRDLDASLAFDYQLTNHLAIRMNFRQEIVESSDPRGEYDRLRGALRVLWEYD